MTKNDIHSLKGFYEALIHLNYRETLCGRFDVAVRCLGPELPYVKHINDLFNESDGMIIRFDTKVIPAKKILPEAENITIKIVDRYYFYLYKKEDLKIPFSLVKFNYINPWEYKEENDDKRITTETVSDKIPVRIDIREYLNDKLQK